MNSKHLIGKEIRKYILELDLPQSDLYELPSSERTFSGGGQYGIEISSVNNLKILEKILYLCDQNGIVPDRFDECRGIIRLPNDDIKEMLKICRERKIGMFFSIGPRAIYDTGCFSRSKNGSRIGYRLRGMENLIRAVEDVKRVIDFGTRGIMVYDEGLLYVLNHLRKKNIIPQDTIIKLSVHCCCSNPASAKLYEENGANTINLIPDLELPMISAIRNSVKCPLDLFTDTAKDAGGMLRTYEVPDLIRIAAPVLLKCGSISQKEQNYLPTEDELGQRIIQIKKVMEIIEQYYPEAVKVNKDETTLGIPL